MPYGVSGPLGAVAYASTVAEIASQANALGFTPHSIVHCSGSGATQAGLVVGARACLPQTRVVGIDIDVEPERVRADVLTFAKGAADLPQQSFDPADVEVVAGHAGPAYGVPHAATIDAMKLGARLEALVLDPVYSGKGLAGLIALIEAGRWRKDQETSCSSIPMAHWRCSSTVTSSVDSASTDARSRSPSSSSRPCPEPTGPRIRATDRV